MNKSVDLRVSCTKMSAFDSFFHRTDSFDEILSPALIEFMLFYGQKLYLDDFAALYTRNERRN